MSDLRTVMFIKHPTVLFPFLISASALGALGPTPSFIPLILVLTLLRIYARIILVPNRPRHRRHVFVTWMCLTFATSIAHVFPALTALSSIFTSLVSLCVISAVASAIAGTAIALDVHLCRQTQDAWLRISIFPVFWAGIWQVWALNAPMGRLTAWSPVVGVHGYAWMKHIFGPCGIDWVVAVFAVVGSEIIGEWFIGPVEQLNTIHASDEQQLVDVDHETPIGDAPAEVPSQPRHTLYLFILLFAFTIPSYFYETLPLPPISSSSTPLTVGCVLPSPPQHNDHSSTLDRFILESQRVVSSGAKVMLWPEGAVRFDSADDREEAIAKVQEKIKGPYVGISFEENAPAEWKGSSGRTKRIGMVLVGPNGPVFEYYKRSLVPYVESFSFLRSPDPPTIYDLPLPPPAHTNKSDWSAGPPFSRPIPITSSICLDFAFPSAFAELPSRAALILAPARTWHPDVGLAMWEQAKARAQEAGSMVLFCDGGISGVSGIAGQGMSEVFQVGSGSWTKTIGVQWPFDERRTTYMRIGNCGVFIALCSLVGVGWVGEIVVRRIRRGPEDMESQKLWHQVLDTVKSGREMIRVWRQRQPGQGEEHPLLV
ncbi:hypothetical protein EW146_g2445 [Bondarzewia mesenterica]|uniref:CN hydrolase domain-containing protein n=1 Tax=Bondarzewia mesenterica TaxID=1095465 RepID=A0A4S4M6R3_9AGAM|nr:hypothetical protein EW146_g2445 [Bondarzewia mesenterica]